MQALLAPVFKSIVLGSVGIAMAVGLGHHSERTEHRLRLHAIAAPNSIYLTAFGHGDVFVRYDAADEPTIRFTMRGTYQGCRWKGYETLVPIDEHSFGYIYTEDMLGCDEGSTPTAKTPRTGIVTVVE